METTPSDPSPRVPRRTVLKAVAWSTPVIALSVAAPASAASTSPYLKVVGPWVVAPYPGSLDHFTLDFNSGLTTFDVSQVFGSDDPDQTWPDRYQLVWSATSTGVVPDTDAFYRTANVQSVTVDNTEWGFDSLCSITVTALPFIATPPVSSRIDFVVTVP